MSTRKEMARQLEMLKMPTLSESTLRRRLAKKKISRTYLSIDLDFWQPGEAIPYAALEGLLERTPNPAMVVDHHDILRYVNSSRMPTFKYLVNLDYHSDLTLHRPAQLKPELNCGTWVNHVRWAFYSEFLWVTKEEAAEFPFGDGRCEPIEYNAETSIDAFKPGNSKWAKTRIRRVKDWSHGVSVNATYPGVCICLSPDYLQHDGDDYLEVLTWFADTGKRLNLLTAFDLDEVQRCRDVGYVCLRPND